MKNLNKSFVGKWESLSVEERPNAWGSKYYLKRYFHNTEEKANGTLVFYTDASASQLNLTLSVVGPYHFGKASPFIPGAIETDFEFTKLIVTPHTEAMVGILNQGRAANSKLKAWKLNETQTVDHTIEEGVMGMVIGKFKEFDVVKIEGDQLYYGERPADGSSPEKIEQRAKSLQAPLKRVVTFSVSKLHSN